MFEDYQERHYNQMVFEAGIHGVNLDGVSGKKEAVKSSPAFEFQSPEEYGSMSKEDRENLTKKMMGQHKLKFG